MTRSAILLALLFTLARPPAARAAAAERIIPGTAGAIAIPIEMPIDGRATLALYGSNGQLVRILAQAIDLAQGTHSARWDGMDLWGNLLPADTTLQLRLFAGPGVRAVYEFTPARGDVAPDAVPWLTKPQGSGLTARTGGWLGDHTGPDAVAAIGDKIFLGSALVEHGHNLIACDLEGNKLWGTQVAGWDGPQQLFALNGTLLARVKNNIFRVDPDSYERQKLHDTGKTNLMMLGTAPGRLLLALENPATTVSPYRYAFGHDDILFDVAVPAAKGSSAPEFQISGQRQFSSVFCSDGGHFQMGLRPVREEAGWYLVVPLKKAATIGTLVIGRTEGLAQAEAFVLAPGVAYNAAVHGTFDIVPGADWEPFGAAPLGETANFITSAKPGGVRSAAILVRFTASPDAPKEAPTLKVCRVLANRVAPAVPRVAIATPAGVELKPAPRGGWAFRTPTPPNAEAPAVVTATLGDTPARCDGVLLVNNLSTELSVDAQAAADWQPVLTFKARYNAKTGNSTASNFGRADFLAFSAPVDARVLRVRIAGAYGRGKVTLSWTQGDAQRIEAEGFIPLRSLDPQPRPQPHFLRVCDAADGRIVSETLCDLTGLRGIAGAADGSYLTLYTNRLCRSQLSGGTWHHQVLNGTDIEEAQGFALAGDRILVGDRNAALILDGQGKLVRKVGGQPYARGPWDRNRTTRCKGLALDRHGKLWVAEEAYAPKRIARFAPDGTCEKEFLGPPQYGGGGWLDPNLQSFYYRGLEYALDWERGRDRLAWVNDRLYSEETPTLDASSFGYTAAGRPIVLNGRTYAVGDPGHQASPGPVVCLLVDHQWRPCATMGSAKDSPFLMRKEVWKKHWLSQPLDDRYFIWIDRNDDGAYQVEEVELFAKADLGFNPFDGGYWGSLIGPDLTIWTPSARLAPSRFSPGGVPIYERRAIQRFSYESLAPLYAKTQIYGSRATTGPNYSFAVCADGSLTVCGQPYRVRPDLTLDGGPLAAKPSDYLPPVPGRPIHQALHFAGTAVTKSPIGEVSVLVGDNGIWSVCSTKYCVMLDRLFSGADGGWGSDLPAVRGTEVGGRKHDWETFFGHFVGGRDGKYYAVSGKGFQAISRVEGLDDIRIVEAPVRVSAASVAANAALRAQLVANAKARENRKGKERSIKAAKADKFIDPIEVNGFVDEWSAFEPLAEGTPATFAAAYDAKGLCLAWTGNGYTGNRCEDPLYLFKGGFALDFRCRLNPKARGDVSEGDRRLVIGRYRNQWTGVLYDYVNPAVPRDQVMEYVSPVVSTTIDKVTVLPAAALQAAARTGGPGRADWAAEAFVPWATLGLQERPKELKFDIGLIEPDSGGVTVERRWSWVEGDSLPVSDVGWEAQINAAAWATMKLE